jgi:micrococcal nuclease
MKKLTVLIMLLTLLLPIKTFAIDEENESKQDIVKLSNCVDSESARFILGVGEIKVKYIGIQLEEKVIDDDSDEINGSFVSEYVCNSLKNAKEIKIQYEPKINKEDKFGRIQAWVFLDGVLLQEDLIVNGYARIMYLEDDYLYTEKLKAAQNYAKENKLGIWKEKEEQPVEEPKKEVKKSKGIIESIIDFFASIINKICEFVDGIIKNIL